MTIALIVFFFFEILSWHDQCIQCSWVSQETESVSLHLSGRNNFPPTQNSLFTINEHIKLILLPQRWGQLQLLLPQYGDCILLLLILLLDCLLLLPQF